MLQKLRTSSIIRFTRPFSSTSLSILASQAKSTQCRTRQEGAEDIEYDLQKAIDDYEKRFKLGLRLTNTSYDPYSVLRGHEDLSISVEKIAKIMHYGKLGPILRIRMRTVASRSFDNSVSMKWTASPINHQLSLSEVFIRLVEQIILHNCVAPIEGYPDYGKDFQHAIRKLLAAYGSPSDSAVDTSGRIRGMDTESAGHIPEAHKLAFQHLIILSVRQLAVSYFYENVDTKKTSVPHRVQSSEKIA